jgi:topoisomerase-4 subunit A
LILERAVPHVEEGLKPVQSRILHSMKRLYDGRNQEPVTLPVKFPLLLAQGVEGIAVGLASKILPHNFNELIDASVAYLRDEEFELFPDFPTGGMIDVSRYNNGLRGGAVKVRAKISKIDRRTLSITEIPYGTTTESIKDSIIKANDRGKIKIRKVDDNTAEKVEIIIHVSNDESSDKTIDALYAFTDCEVSISPNATVIWEDKPHFLGVSDILRRSTDRTRELLDRELHIRLDELAEDWHMSSLEKIFIENKLYQLIEGAKTREQAYSAVDEGLEPFKKLLRRAVTKDDVVKLTELRFIRISRYDTARADEHIKSVEEEMRQVRHDIEHIVPYTIAWYQRIKQKYGAGRERRTEIREFEGIEAAKVVTANAKLYVNRAEGFFGIGAGMKKDEFVCDCSDIDDVIVIGRDGRYVITKVSDKAFFGKNILYIGVFKRGDERTIYNVLYRDGKNGPVMMKRCAIVGITRDKEYDMTKGTPASDILYLSVNPNGEAEVLKVYFKPRPRLKKVITDLDFSTLAIKGRASQGNLFSRYGIHKIVLKEKGASTLGGQNIWFDEEVRRLNADGRGVLLGEFEGDDRIVVFTRRQYYVTGYELTHHFPEDTIRVEKWDPERVYSVTYWDEGQRYYYVKRFPAVTNGGSQQDYLDADCRLVEVTDRERPILQVSYAGANASRPIDTVNVAEYIGVKSHKAKGKRITTYTVGALRFLEPLPDDDPSGPSDSDPDDDPDADTAPVDESFDLPESETETGDEYSDDDEPMPTPSAVPTATPAQEEGDLPAAVELEIERTAPVDDTRNPPSEQLNLF